MRRNAGYITNFLMEISSFLFRFQHIPATWLFWDRIDVLIYIYIFTVYDLIWETPNISVELPLDLPIFGAEVTDFECCSSLLAEGFYRRLGLQTIGDKVELAPRVRTVVILLFLSVEDLSVE